jgi:ferrous iron transport protein A
LLQRRRHGLVLANRGTRIALGDSIARHLKVSPC